MKHYSKHQLDELFLTKPKSKKKKYYLYTLFMAGNDTKSSGSAIDDTYNTLVNFKTI